MIYIFEDHESDPIPRLFMKSYDEETASEFIYTRGNGNIKSILDDVLKQNDTIILFLDVVPGNDSLNRLYKIYRRKSITNDYKIIIMPIIGAEYYFIKSIQKEPVHTNADEIKNCVERKSFFDSPVISTPQDREFCKYYERYCKLILEKLVFDCIRNNTDDGINSKFRVYFNEDCKCEEPEACCREKTLFKKSESLVRAYPYVPSGSRLKNITFLSVDDLWKIHRQLVDEHNVLNSVLKTSEPDTNRLKLYKEIKYIK